MNESDETKITLLDLPQRPALRVTVDRTSGDVTIEQVQDGESFCVILDRDDLQHLRKALDREEATP